MTFLIAPFLRPYLLGLLLTTNVAFAESFPVKNPASEGFSPERLARLTEMSEQYVAQGRVAGIVNLVLRNGAVIHFESTGTRGAFDETPLKKDDLFRIYSMTKPITAVAAMQLYEQGKFQLSDPVAKFVPELAELKVINSEGGLEPLRRAMTMHDLLLHTTGLSYGFSPVNDVVDQRYQIADLWASSDLDDFASRVARLPLKFQPGERWHYSIAVDITGLVVQRLSGQRFDRYLKEHIFEPLGMTDTFFEVPTEKRDRFLPNHFIDPKTGKLADTINAPEPFNYRDKVAMIDFLDVSFFSGGGGLVSTASDYARFAEMLRRGGALDGRRILGTKTVAFMTKNHLNSETVVDIAGETPEAFRSQQHLNNLVRPDNFGNQSASAIGRVGFGFGLGFGVVTDSAAIGIMGSDGEYNWGGAAGTVFWVDPEEELVVVSMIQLMLSPWPLRSDLKIAIYQALEESYAD